MKRIKGIVSTALLAGTVMFGGMSASADADTTVKPYQVVTPGEHNEKTVTIGFDTKNELESYVKKHPVVPNVSKLLQSSASIYSTFYHDINLQGAKFTVNASRNPVKITNIEGANNDAASSILTHPFGNYTMVYEHSNGQGRGLAIINNGGYLNFTNISMGDGVRTWNDGISSVIVQAN